MSATEQFHQPEPQHVTLIPSPLIAPQHEPHFLSQAYFLKKFLNLPAHPTQKQLIQHLISWLLKVASALSIGLVLSEKLLGKLVIPELSASSTGIRDLTRPVTTVNPSYSEEVNANTYSPDSQKIAVIALYYLMIVYGASQFSQAFFGLIQKYGSALEYRAPNLPENKRKYVEDILLALLAPRGWYKLVDTTDNSPANCCGWKGIWFIIMQTITVAQMASLLYFELSRKAEQTKRSIYHPGGVPGVIYENAHLTPLSTAGEVCYQFATGFGVIGFYALLGALSQLSRTTPLLRELRAILDRMYSAIYEKIAHRFATTGEDTLALIHNDQSALSYGSTTPVMTTLANNAAAQATIVVVDEEEAAPLTA